MTLLQRAATLRRAASELLRVTGVDDVLSQLGHVHAVGSFRLDVMFRPDIDLIVISEAPSRERAISLTRLFLERGHFQTVGFADCFSYRKPGTPRGFYWELIAPHAGDWWKFDIWYLAPADDRSVATTERFERLLQENPAARETILHLKHHFFDGVKYRDGVTGFAIYDAVLNRGVRSPAEFAQVWEASAQRQ